MKRILIHLIHPLIYLLIHRLNQQIECASLTPSPNSSLKTTKDQVNNRLLDKQPYLTNYAIHSYEINHEIVKDKDLNEEKPIDLAIDNQEDQQTLNPTNTNQIKHRNCGLQQLNANRFQLPPALTLNERNSIALSKLIKLKLDQKQSENKNEENKSRHLINYFNKLDPHFNKSSVNNRSSSLKSNQRKGKVVGGDLAYEGEFPWIASIRKFENHHCGGVLINEFYVLTGS